mmetsp:Transcript_34428/g.106912  ORF Transcript_34428/g.106912 Transcript_34428/m.106912 type:complete len:225 (+) Transcript_34428:236-910(+)
MMLHNLLPHDGEAKGGRSPSQGHQATAKSEADDVCVVAVPLPCAVHQHPLGLAPQCVCLPPAHEVLRPADVAELAGVALGAARGLPNVCAGAADSLGVVPGTHGDLRRALKYVAEVVIGIPCSRAKASMRCFGAHRRPVRGISKSVAKSARLHEDLLRRAPWRHDMAEAAKASRGCRIHGRPRPTEQHLHGNGHPSRLQGVVRLGGMVSSEPSVRLFAVLQVGQ